MQFPKDWMRIIEAPKEFYALRLEPVRSALQVGDPVLVRVTIMNISDFDLTVGPEGVLHQDLWLDAQLRGAQQQVLQSESFDRITKRLILPARQTMSQVVRLDSAALSGLLLSNPQRTFQLSAMVMTNPVTIQGQVTSGLAGYRAQMETARMMERQGAPITNEQVRARLNNTMIGGTPSDKVQVVELVATYYQVFSAAEDPQTKQMGAPFGEAVRRAATDADPGTRAWSLYVMSLLTGEQDRPTVVKTLSQDPGWHGRLLACVTVALTGNGKDLIKPLEKDEDPIVAKMAKAIGKMKLTPRQAPAGAGPGSAPPATRPATGPADTGVPGLGTTPGAPGAAPAGATTPPTISIPSAAPEGTPSISTSAPPTTSPAIP
jgi:hypothetical protein